MCAGLLGAGREGHCSTSVTTRHVDTHVSSRLEADCLLGRVDHRSWSFMFFFFFSFSFSLHRSLKTRKVDSTKWMDCRRCGNRLWLWDIFLPWPLVLRQFWISMMFRVSILVYFLQILHLCLWSLRCVLFGSISFMQKNEDVEEKIVRESRKRRESSGLGHFRSCCNFSDHLINLD